MKPIKLTFPHKIYCFIIGVFLSLSFAQAQEDIQFSQYDASPLFVNPGMTGLFNGNFRANAIYRNQWYSILPENPFRTLYISFDTKIPSYSGNNHLGIGLVLYNDVAGSLSYSNTQVELSLAYKLALATQHHVSFGIKGGGGQRGWFDLSQARFGQEFDGSGYDPTIGSGETNISNNIWYPTLSSGLMYYFTSNTRTNIFAGGGVQHVNTPNISFFDDQALLKSKIHFQAGGNIELNPRWDVAPSIYFFKQGKGFHLNSGALLRYVFYADNKGWESGERAFGLGARFRMTGNEVSSAASESIIIIGKLDYEYLRIGLSYDFNVSNLRTANNGNGGFELSLTYFSGYSKTNKALECPRF